MFGGTLGDGFYGGEAVAVDEVCIINVSMRRDRHGDEELNIL